MALGSQQGRTVGVSSLTGLLHEVYAGEVKPSIRANSPTLQLFTEAGPGQYRIDGEKLVGSADLEFSTGAMHTSGKLPDHREVDAVEWTIQPTRAYRRGAIDNFTEARGGKGPGSFGDYAERLFDQVYDSFKRLKIRSAIGGSSGILMLTASRTSNAIVVMKDGYNHTGTNPMMHIQRGACLAWLDASNSFAVGGSGIIQSQVNSTKTVTFAASIENGSGTPTLVAGDPWVFATTTPYTVDYFDTEYNVARHGLSSIIEPDDVNTTVLGIAEGTYPAWRPFKEASGTFDHLELTEHWRKLAAQSMDPVTPASHTVVTSGAVYAELARTLEGYQQQQQLGKTFEGGYQAVRIAGQDIIDDPYMLHNVLFTVCRENLFNVDIGGSESEFDDDGSMFQRIGDFDGKEWYIREYGNQFSDRRNRHGALTAIGLPNVDEDDFTAVPGA